MVVSRIFKYFISFCFIALFLLGNSASAANEEEKACFKILTEKAQNLYGTDISSVWNGTSTVDLSTYNSFKSNRQWQWWAWNPKFFNSQRNNIGTVVLSYDYITSQYSPFWAPTNFKFPIDNNGNYIGEAFVNFRSEMVYTHHNIYDGWSFLSCWYLKITPVAGKTYFDLDPANYFSNRLDGSSWFEIDSSTWVASVGHYIVGKSKVSGGYLSWGVLEKLFTIDIVNVIYDNQSTWFNEYETYPLQVDAMTNADAFSTAWSIQQDFISRVMNETCLESVHSVLASLPAFCANTYSSKSSVLRTNRAFARIFSDQSLLSLFMSFLVPEAHARLDEAELKEVQSQVRTNFITGSTVMIDQNFDYFDYQKLNTIPSQSFRDYFLLATNRTYDQILQSKVASSWTLSEYENILVWCWFTYEKRLSLLKEWIKKMDPTKFSIDNIEYPDPKLGDCVIPFPDRRNKELFISWSFLSNQQYAKYLSDRKTSTLDPKIAELRESLLIQEKEYGAAIQAANLLISRGEVEKGQKLLSDAKVQFEPKIKEIQQDMSTILNPELSNPQRNTQLIWWAFTIFWVILISATLYFRRKKLSNHHLK